MGNLNPRWTLLRNDEKYLMSELFTKVPLREKFSSFPAAYSPNLLLSELFT